MRHYGVLISQGRDGCVQLWAVGGAGALDRSQPICEIRTGSFNFCRCAVWAPGGGEVCEGPEAAAAPETPGQAKLRDVRVACAAHDPSDVGVWRPGESPHAVVHLRQRDLEPKHGMCMSLAFLRESGFAQQPVAGETAAGTGAVPDSASQRTHLASPYGGGEGGGRGAAAAGASAGLADPRFVVSGYEDGVVALWDLRSPGRPLGCLRVHGEPVMCLAVHARAPGRRRRPEGEAPGEAPATGRAGHDAWGGDADSGGASASFDLVSGSADDQIACFAVRPTEPQPLSLTAQLRLRQAGTADVAIRPDGKLFACGCWDGRARLYSLRRREPLAVLKYHRGQITAVALSPETSTLATASRDTTVALWSVYTTAGARQ